MTGSFFERKMKKREREDQSNTAKRLQGYEMMVEKM